MMNEMLKSVQKEFEMLKSMMNKFMFLKLDKRGYFDSEKQVGLNTSEIETPTWKQSQFNG